MKRLFSTGRRFRRGPDGITAAGLALVLGVSGSGCRRSEENVTPGTRGEDVCLWREGDRKDTDRDERAKKKAHVEKERLDMREQIYTLARSLAQKTAERDRNRLDRGSEAKEGEFFVRSYDGSWGWVMLAGGAESGFHPGQKWNVYRGDIWVARIRIAEVREQVSGAWVEELRAGWAPTPGDRVLQEQRER